jgi:hypothetical protein
MNYDNKQERAIFSNAGNFAVITKLLSLGHNVLLGEYKRRKVIVGANPKSKDRYYELIIKTNNFGIENNKEFGEMLPWLMHKQPTEDPKRKLFYCFVSINLKKDSFRYFIVPVDIVLKSSEASFKYWVGRNVSRHDSGLRSFMIGLKGKNYPVELPLEFEYEDRWDLLK